MHVKEQIDKSFTFLIVKIYPVKMELKKYNVLAMRVSLFIPCLIDQFHPQIGESVVRILKKIIPISRYR